MNREEIFEKFASDSLSDPESISLYARLSTDSELRAEFHTYLSISKNMKVLSNAFLPALESKSRIFEKAGFTIPAATTAVETSKTADIIKKPAAAFNKYKSFSSGFIAGGLLVALLMYLMTNNTNFEQQEQTSANKYPISSVKSSEPVKIEDNTAENNLDKNTTPIIKYKYIYKNADEVKNVNEINDQIKEEKVEDVNILASDLPVTVPSQPKSLSRAIYPKLELKTPKSEFDFREYFGQLIYVSPEFNLKPIESSTYNSGFVFELQSSYIHHSNEEIISPDKLNMFNNLSGTLFYELSESVKLGFEVKQETFMTEYTGQEASGLNYKYYQQPNFTTFSFVTRFMPVDIFGFKPFAQLGFGFNQGGYTAKPKLGFEYSITDRFSLISALEYTHFWFYHGSNWFNTKKYGVSYGLSYKF